MDMLFYHTVIARSEAMVPSIKRTSLRKQESPPALGRAEKWECAIIFLKSPYLKLSCLKSAYASIYHFFLPLLFLSALPVPSVKHYVKYNILLFKREAGLRFKKINEKSKFTLLFLFKAIPYRKNVSSHALKVSLLTYQCGATFSPPSFKFGTNELNNSNLTINSTGYMA